MFYRIYNSVAKPNIIEGVAEFCLMDRRVINAVSKLRETHRFMRGIFSWAGFKISIVDYVCTERSEGETKFNFRKLFKLAFEGLLSFSTFPLNLIFYIGFISAFAVIFYGIYGLFKNLFSVPMFFVLILCSINLFCSCILGIYAHRIFVQSKNRPLYIVREIYSKEHEKINS